jgi:hypothetical protein
MLLEPGEFLDEKLVNDYRTKYVVFLDLLGFSALVDRIGQDVLERHRLVESLKLVRDTLCENPAIDFRFTYFSDCIVISAEHSPHALWQIFQSVQVLTVNLLQYDILVRGGMTVGATHHSDDFVFGTAMTEAYRLENKVAQGPRVLLSQQVIDEVDALGPSFKQWLREDEDGRFFIHTLMSYSEYTKEAQIGKVVLTYPAQRIAYFIGQRLEKDTDGVLEKARWFQAYWNKEVASRAVLPRIEIGSQPTLPPDSLTIITRRLVAPVIRAKE